MDRDELRAAGTTSYLLSTRTHNLHVEAVRLAELLEDVARTFPDAANDAAKLRQAASLIQEVQASLDA